MFVTFFFSQFDSDLTPDEHIAEALKPTTPLRVRKVKSAPGPIDADKLRAALQNVMSNQPFVKLNSLPREIEQVLSKYLPGSDPKDQSLTKRRMKRVRFTDVDEDSGTK
jgi:hypothetical protein